MTAETCGRSAMPANVAPPLKSTSTKLSASGEWVIDSASTRVRSSSDLPEPVAPMTQAVRPHALLGGLLDVERDDGTRLVDADRHAQPVALQPRPPRGLGVEVAHVAAGRAGRRARSRR